MEEIAKNSQSNSRTSSSKQLPHFIPKQLPHFIPKQTPALHHPPHLTCLPPSQSLRRGLCLWRIVLPPRSESELDRPFGLLSSRLLLVTPPAPILFKWEVESHLIQHVLVLSEIATKAPCQNSHLTPIFSIHLPDLGRTTTSRMRELFSNSLHPMTSLSAYQIKFPSRDCLRHSVTSSIKRWLHMFGWTLVLRVVIFFR